MIVHIAIHAAGPASFDYVVSAEGQTLYADVGLGSIVHCLAAAIEGMGPEAKAAELALAGVVSGTYPLQVLARRPADVAQHAVSTTTAVLQALRE